MSMINKIIYENSFEIGIAVLTLVVLVGAVTFMTPTDFVKSKIISSEISYISSMISSTDSLSVDLKYDNLQVKNQENKITTKYKDKEMTKTHFGEKISISQNNKIITISS